MKIAIIEDEKRLAEMLACGIESEGHVADIYPDVATARAGIEYSGNLYDIIILDLMLPDGDGTEVCKAVRSTGVNSPILVLTARDLTEDKVRVLNGGADDFMTKPFEFEELLARANALSRRAQQEVLVHLTIGDVTLFPERYEARRAGRSVYLTVLEFELLLYLARNRGRVIGRDELYAKLWNEEVGPSTNVVDVHVRNLRKKIDDPYTTKLIQTVYGAGYTITE